MQFARFTFMPLLPSILTVTLQAGVAEDDECYLLSGSLGRGGCAATRQTKTNRTHGTGRKVWGWLQLLIGRAQGRSQLPVFGAVIIPAA